VYPAWCGLCDACPCRHGICVSAAATGATHIATNLALDQALLDRAFRVSGEPTKKVAVTRALQAFIAQREQRRVAELFGKLDWDCAYDYNAERARKP
jgi:Bacterial antitoxin of type II TA system, VapB